MENDDWSGGDRSRSTELVEALSLLGENRKRHFDGLSANGLCGDENL